MRQVHDRARPRDTARIGWADARFDLAFKLLKRLQVGGCEPASDADDIDQLSLLSA